MAVTGTYAVSIVLQSATQPVAPVSRVPVSQAANRRLLGRLYDALRPGGTLAVIDVIPERLPTPRWVALYELGLLLRTTSGRVHQLAAYLGLLHDAGFEPPERHCLTGQTAVLLAARKPADG